MDLSETRVPKIIQNLYSESSWCPIFQQHDSEVYPTFMITQRCRCLKRTEDLDPAMKHLEVSQASFLQEEHGITIWVCLKIVYP